MCSYGPAMTSGVIFMINKETFVHAMRLAHDALHLLQRPEDDGEFNILINLVIGYISLLVGFDEELYKIVHQFLLKSSTFDVNETELLFDYICDGDGILN